MEHQLKRALKSKCRPDEPIGPHDERHHDFDDPKLHLRGRPWRAWLADEIRLADKPTAQMVTGLRGSGKTTELKQLQALLEGEAYRVVYADIEPWLGDGEPITTTDLLLASVLAFHPSGRPDNTTNWAREYAAQFGKLLGSEVTVEGGVEGLKGKLTTDQTLFQRVARHLRQRDGLREDVFALLARPAEAAAAEGEELILILDGAEKRATGELHETKRRAEFQNAWSGAFVQQARDLRPPRLHLIYTVPPFMIRRTSEIAASFGCELQFLPMVRVFDHTGQLHAPGLDAVVDALTKRIPAEHFEELAVMYWLAAWSGGYFRDLLRFVNYMIHAVGEQPKFTRAHASYATDQVRQSYTQAISLSFEERQVLEQLHPSRRFPDHEAARERMDTLLQGFKMFRYHNDHDWYDAHPLLWPVMGFDPPITWDQAVALAAARDARSR